MLIDLKSDLASHKRCFLAPQEADAVQWTGKNKAQVILFLNRFDKKKSLSFQGRYKTMAPGSVYFHINGEVLELKYETFKKITTMVSR